MLPPSSQQSFLQDAHEMSQGPTPQHENSPARISVRKAFNLTLSEEPTCGVAVMVFVNNVLTANQPLKSGAAHEG